MARRKTDKTVAPVNELVTQLLDIDDLPAFVRELPFAPGRRWAFDIAWPDLMVALEYEGNTWVAGGSRHTTGLGYRLDVDKYNEASILGWCVIRVTSDMVRDLSYLDPLLRAIYIRQGEREKEEPAPTLPNGAKDWWA